MSAVDGGAYSGMNWQLGEQCHIGTLDNVVAECISRQSLYCTLYFMGI